MCLEGLNFLTSMKYERKNEIREGKQGTVSGESEFFAPEIVKKIPVQT
jgi:hypothetical protein